jgi:hypothetical protein
MTSPGSAEASSLGYDSSDLAYFDGLVDEIVADLRQADADRLRTEEPVIRARLAAAVFRCAAPGERDNVALKRRIVGIVAGG